MPVNQDELSINQESSPSASLPQKSSPAFRELTFFFIGSFFLSLFYLYLVFSSTVLWPFASSGDFHVFQAARFDCGDFSALARTGGILPSWLNCLLEMRVHQLIDLSFARLLTMLFLSIGLAGFVSHLYNLGWNKIISLSVAGAIFSLPGFLTLILTAMSTPLTLSFILALCGHGLIEKLTPSDLRKGLLSLKALTWGALSLACLLAAGDISPAGMMFFLVPTTAIVLFKNMDEWPDTRLRFLRNGTWVSISGLTLMLTHRPVEGFQPLAESRALISLNLWNIYFSANLAVAVVAIILLGAMMTGGAYILGSSDPAERSKRLRWSGQAVAIILALTLMTGSTTLFNAWSGISFLALLPCQAVLALLLFWAITRIAGFIPGKLRQTIIQASAVAMMLVGGLLGQRHVFDTAYNQLIMRNYIRMNIQPHLESLHAVHFVTLADSNRSYTNFPILSVVGEFNAHYEEKGYPDLVLSLLIDHRDRLNSRDAMSVKLADYEQQKDAVQSFPGTIVTMSKSAAPIHAPADAIVIDMNHLMALPVMKEKPPVPIFIPDDAPCEQYLARMGTIFSPFGSIYAIKKCAKEFIARSYSFKIGQVKDALAMPHTWTLQGSNNKLLWYDLDTQAGQSDWEKKESRSFKIARPGAYLYYRLQITEENIPAFQINTFSVSPRVKTTPFEDNSNLWSPSLANFWWESSPYPHITQMEFDPPLKASRYYLISSSGAESQMPTDWMVQGSNDGIQWDNLDVRGKQPPWKELEKRLFSIINPGKYRYYRFIFTAGGNPQIIQINKLRFLP